MSLQSLQTALKTRNLEYLNCEPLTSDIHPLNEAMVHTLLDHIGTLPVICHDILRKMNKSVFQEASETFDIVKIKLPHDEFVLYDAEFNSAVVMKKVPPTEYIGESLTCFVFSNEEDGEFCMNPVSIALPLKGGRFLFDNYIRTNKDTMELGNMAMEHIFRALFILHGLKNHNFTIKKKGGIKTVHAPSHMTTQYDLSVFDGVYPSDSFPNIYKIKLELPPFHRTP